MHGSTTRLFEAAGRHFNRGQRGYLGWFVSPWVLFVTAAAAAAAAAVVIVTWRRQFASNAWHAMGS